MAELYLRQGHRERAIEIYQKLARERPDDVHLTTRLRELEQEGEPMSFREHLQEMVDDVPGAMSAMVMGFDGIAIDTYEKTSPGVDVPSLLVEYSAAAQTLRRSAEAAGSLVEMSVAAGQLAVLLRPLTEEYFIAVLLGPGGLAGKARFKMRVIAPKVAKELL